jgi:hypothetical protein
LGAVQSLGGTRESLLFDHGEKCLQLVNVHKRQAQLDQVLGPYISIVDDFEKNYKFDL